MPPEAMNSNDQDLAGAPPSDLVVLVDPYSTGCWIGKEMAKRGYGLVALWTYGFAPEMKLHVPVRCGTMNYFAEIDEAPPFPNGEKNLIETVSRVREIAGDANVVACIAGGEAGVDVADALSEHLGLASNGTDIPNRRDKKIQQELIRKVGLRSVRQASGTVFSEVEQFLKTESYPVVLKPTESAGSDGVKLCHTFEEAKEHFHVLMASQLVNGGACPAVLCQEFLKGKEYVVDHVSLNGVHKTMMVWVYDKREANGSAFVYFGLIPIDAQSPEAKILVPYIRGVLDALGVKHGPSHGEVIITEDGPCLVEMNCRAHGGDGNWRPLCRALTGGYSQVEASVDAFLDPEAFHQLPDLPPSPFRASGQEITLVSYSQGIVKSTPGLDVIKHLPSFVCMETGFKPGSKVEYTVDLVTCIASVILMHPDADVLQRDIDFIRHLERINGLFDYETKPENLKRPQGDAIWLESINEKLDAKAKKTHTRVFSSEGPNLVRHMSNDRPELRGGLVKRVTTVDASKEVVVVVNPHSTGCCVVEEMTKRGYNIIKLWTRGISEEMKRHVPFTVRDIKYHAELEEGNDIEETVTRIFKAAGNLRVVACIAGGDVGIDVADALSERLKVRSNGTRIPNKRDKKFQQDQIKKHGLRSIRQAAGDKFEEVEFFLRREAYPVVLKPVESAGSDGVKLCHNFDEAKAHFDILMKSQTINGGKFSGVLCQEFLRGKEYVVDHVSRDGEHKTMMVWVYDKRPANGSAFVYFGCVPVDPMSPDARLLIPYVRRVLNAMDIKNGPSHAEVVMTDEGPCLVEVNARTNGGDGSWRPLCLALTGGYSQVEATVDSYLDKRQFMLLPDLPPSPFKACGQEVNLVSYSRGTVKATPGFEEIKNLPSFVYLETGVRVGSKVDYTVDLLTGIGVVVLMHEDELVLQKDVNRIRELEKQNGLFEYERSQVKFRSGSIKFGPVVSSSDRPEIY